MKKCFTERREGEMDPASGSWEEILYSIKNILGFDVLLMGTWILVNTRNPDP